VVILIIVALVVGLVLTKLTLNSKFWRFFLINIGIIVIYNVIIWGTVFEFYNGGEAGVVPIFWDIVITCIHLVTLFIITVITAIKTAVKEQTKN
jgi:glucan phosphoethanolaminetransferase (alkaline phosphatase superfamily)